MASPDQNLVPGTSSGSSMLARGRPVLVTGVPRSGTTWLARELAGAGFATMPGREPMNPRSGQFGLGGTLSSWVELRELSRAQQRLLSRCYHGREPRVFSRYGKGQWLAPLPWSRTIVKDPFALLSVPTIVQCTGAVAVIVYRHPGAVLASYRRMGWTADTAEIRRLQGLTTAPVPTDDLNAMVEFWNFLHGRVLSWLADVPGALLVSHAEVSRGGPESMRSLMRACGLRPSTRRSTSTATAVPGPGRLHGFAREADEVIDGWRGRLSAEETSVVEAGTSYIWDSLEERRFALS